MKSHPIPSDKGSIGGLEQIAVNNRRLLQQIFSEDSSSIFASAMSFQEDGQPDPYDDILLKKLRGLYDSCMDEELLNARGADPLLRVIKEIRRRFKGEVYDPIAPENAVADDDKEKERLGLTAAVAYLHSRGVGGLFSVDIDGDVGDDPNKMTLLFGQPGLGLPSPEYYEEESITDLYRTILERLLLNLYKEEEALAAQEQVMEPSGLTVNEERLRMWPPWPWPPWDGDDDDDGGDDGGHRKPGNHSEQARKLAKNIIKFEKQIANISLDLYVALNKCYGFAL